MKFINRVWLTIYLSMVIGNLAGVIHYGSKACTLSGTLPDTILFLWSSLWTSVFLVSSFDIVIKIVKEE